jgi:hypothetical protein
MVWPPDCSRERKVNAARGNEKYSKEPQVFQERRGGTTPVAEKKKKKKTIRLRQSAAQLRMEAVK